MRWRIKGAVQKVLGYVPAGDQIHYVLQKHAGGLKRIDHELDAKVVDWTLMVGHLKSSGVPIAGARFLEMGTGWYPTFPFLLYLAGAGRVETLDLNRYMRPELTLGCAMGIEWRISVIAQAAGLKVGEVLARQLELVRALRRGASVEEATQGVVQYRAPADASATGLPAASVDVVFSNSVLEHVPGDVIQRCFDEARRILVPGGVMFHSVNCGDHYAYVDGRISQLNYLRYGNGEWAWWNNRFLYQNRLRAADFTAMAKRSGFKVEIDTSRPAPQRLAELEAIKVHPDFAHYSRDQLAITSIDFVGRNV